MKLAILGGTFDPIHIGHLIAAEQVADAIGLDKILFIPAGNPPHKQDPHVSDAEHRYAMTKLAIESNPRFSISRLEIDRTGPSYSINTIRWLNQRYGMGQVGFIIGVDALAEVHTWYQHQDVIREANFLVIHRPSYDLSALQHQVPEEWLQNLHFIEINSVDVSSTEIRDRVSRGKSIRYLTPDPVIRYIYEHQLYRFGD